MKRINVNSKKISTLAAAYVTIKLLLRHYFSVLSILYPLNNDMETSENYRENVAA
jgi:hypothetical protein